MRGFRHRCAVSAASRRFCSWTKGDLVFRLGGPLVTRVFVALRDSGHGSRVDLGPYASRLSSN